MQRCIAKNMFHAVNARNAVPGVEKYENVLGENAPMQIPLLLHTPNVLSPTTRYHLTQYSMVPSCRCVPPPPLLKNYLKRP